jgi:phosphoglycerate dehydrogenase-like enzyme
MGKSRTKHAVAVLPPATLFNRLFSPEDAGTLSERYAVTANLSEKNLSLEQAAKLVKSAEAVVTSWGSPKFDETLLVRAPKLKLLVHGAGSVKPFVSHELFARGVRVSSSASAIAEDVAVSTIGHIICGLKNTYQASRAMRDGGWGMGDLAPARDILGKTIGVVGASRVGRRVLKLLKVFPVNILLYDPFVDKKTAKSLGAKKCELDELLKNSDVVTLHAPAVESTRHMLSTASLALLKNNVLLVNTARGMLIDEAALIDFLHKHRNASAVLDVTDPEPPADDSPLRRLANVVLTPHIAGSTESGLTRIGSHILDELQLFFGKGRLNEEIREEMLERIG